MFRIGSIGLAVTFMVGGCQSDPDETFNTVLEASFAESEYSSRPQPPPAFDLTVSASDAIPGVDFVVDVSGADPLSTIRVVRGQVGGFTCPPPLGGDCFDLASAVVFMTGVADAAGEATLIVTLPATVPVGAPLSIQVLGGNGPTFLFSDVVTKIIGEPSSTGTKTVFVSSVLYDGLFGSVAGADAECQALADAAGIVGTFKAWISTESDTVAARFTHSTDPYALPDGTVIADNWDDLTDGELNVPINQTELLGTTPVSFAGICGFDDAVWSGTDEFGEAYLGGAYDCDNWTAEAASSWGKVEYYDFAPWSWANTCLGGLCGGDWVAGVYCFQQ